MQTPVQIFIFSEKKCMPYSTGAKPKLNALRWTLFWFRCGCRLEMGATIEFKFESVICFISYSSGSLCNTSNPSIKRTIVGTAQLPNGTLSSSACSVFMVSKQRQLALYPANKSNYNNNTTTSPPPHPPPLTHPINPTNPTNSAIRGCKSCSQGRNTARHGQGRQL